MSAVRTVALKLRAWEAGAPVPRYDTIHHSVTPPDQTLVVSFVRMAGESRPWGLAWGAVGSEPTVQSVPDGRVRDDVAVLAAAFAEDLLGHMRVHNWTYNPIQQKAEPSELRQVWFANGQHIAMLHHLCYAYSQTRFGGDNQEILCALGRLAGWMFRDTSRTGNQHVVNASELLSDSYVFPAQDARTAHLGFQLAWLTTDGDRDRRIAAAAHAESLTVSPTMDPALERDRLQHLVEAWQRGRRASAPVPTAADGIASILRAELERRWSLTERAYQLMASNERPVNHGTVTLVRKALEEFWYQHQRIELNLGDSSQGPAFVAHPETDFHGSAAASRYLIHRGCRRGLRLLPHPRRPRVAGRGARGGPRLRCAGAAGHRHGCGANHDTQVAAAVGSDPAESTPGNRTDHAPRLAGARGDRRGDQRRQRGPSRDDRMDGPQDETAPLPSYREAGRLRVGRCGSPLRAGGRLRSHPAPRSEGLGGREGPWRLVDPREGVRSDRDQRRRHN